MSTSTNPLSAAALFSLSGWVTVVTGGGTGIGLMTAKALAANGAKVYITGRRTQVLETSAAAHGSPAALGGGTGSIVALTMDVTDRESVLKAVKHIEETDGRVDLLVNNAGVHSPMSKVPPEAGVEAYSKSLLESFTKDDYGRAFDTNCTSVYFVTAAFLPLLAKAEGGPNKKPGSVINNTSISGSLRHSQTRQFPYNVSKAAANHLTQQMALEFHNKNIRVRVNGLLLGVFPSEMTTGQSNEVNESQCDEARFLAAIGQFCDMKALHRMGNAQDLASAVLLLATNEYMWGNLIAVDGGWLLAGPGTF